MPSASHRCQKLAIHLPSDSQNPCPCTLTIGLAAGELIRSKIPGASLTILDAAHISNIEQSHAFTDAVVGFLTQP